MIQDTTITIANSAKRFFTGTLISRASGLFREIAMAFVFGATPAAAAFWMAFRFAHLLRRLFGEGALNSAFVPHFESLRNVDPKEGARFFYDLSTGVAFLLLFLTLLIEGILGGCLVYCDLSLENAQVVRLTMLMLPALVFISLYALNTSLLGCERCYFVPSVAPFFLNLTWIVALFWVWKKPAGEAIESLAKFIVFAFAFQWAATLPQVFRYLTKTLGSKWHEKRFSKREILKILRPFALGILGVAATQINSALDSIFARSADSQGPAYLWYAIRIQQLPLALFGLGLTGALLPPIARALQSGQKERYVNFLNFAVERSILLLIPMTAALFALSFSGINLVYGHGLFTEEDALQTALCLWAYGGALFPITLVLLLASAFYARKNYRIPTFISLLAVGLNCALNALFVFVFHWGAISIALATALAACVNCGILAYLLKEDLDFKKLALFFMRVLAASLAALCISVILGSKLFHDNTFFWLIGRGEVVFPRELFGQLIAFIGQALSFGGAFFFCCSLLRIHQIRELLGVKR